MPAPQRLRGPVLPAITTARTAAAKSGKVSAQVKKFLPAVEAVEPVAEQKAPAARSQTAKARAAMTNDDDIPF